jgi:hypothetical protein
MDSTYGGNALHGLPDRGCFDSEAEPISRIPPYLGISSRDGVNLDVDVIADHGFKGAHNSSLLPREQRSACEHLGSRRTFTAAWVG